jgi:GntR family transcriptional regulator
VREHWSRVAHVTAVRGHAPVGPVSPSPTQLGRVYHELATRLGEGRLRRGDRLPAERVLCEELQVSRVTLRRALALLRDEGVIYSIRGAGTYVVASPMLGEAPNNLLSFSRLSQSRGLTPSAELLGLDEHAASIEEGESCGIAAGTPVVSIERLRKLDGIPVAVSRSVIPVACAPSVLEVDWSTASLYDELTRAGNKPVRADYAIEARGADAATAVLLKISVGEPVLTTDVTSYAADARVVEVGTMTYRGDRYRFRSTVHVT